MMWRMMLALVLSLAITLAIGPTVIRELKKLRFGKKLYDLGPKHQQKEGTPYMGGIMMVISVLIVVPACHPLPWQGGWDLTLGVLAISLLSMLVGFADDFIQMKKRQHDGLTPKQKLAGQLIGCAAFAVWCYCNPSVGSAIRIPFTTATLDLGWAYIPVMTVFAMLVINSSNLQDGLDGLEGTQTSVGCGAWAIIAVILMLLASRDGQTELAGAYYGVGIFAIALLGASRGYLRFNRFPAKVFMGDTGSMFIGGAMVGMAYVTRQPLLLLLTCFTMFMSSGSVILQRYYFKLTHGKRIFKMSPVHHHFELIGYKETQIVAMYATINYVLSAIAVLAIAGQLL